MPTPCTQSAADIMPAPVKRPRGRPKKETINQVSVSERKQYTQLNERERKRLRDDAAAGMMIKDLAGRYEIANSSVSNIVNEKAAPKVRGGAVYTKLKKPISQFLAREMLKDPTVTGSKLSSLVKDTFNVEVSPNTNNLHVRSPAMEKNECPVFSLKRLSTHEEARNSDATKQARIQYVQRYRSEKMSGRPFIFIDETSFNKFEYRSQGRSPVGTSCLHRRRRFQTENICAFASCHHSAVTRIYVSETGRE